MLWLPCRDGTRAPPAPALLPDKEELPSSVSVCALRGNGASLAPALPLARAETTIACGEVHVCTGKKKNQFSSAIPTPLAPIQPLAKACTPGKKWNQLRSATQALGPWPHPQPRQRLLSHVGEAQLLQGSCSSLLGHHPSPDRSSTAIEHRRSPGLHLALALVPSNPALPPTKAEADSTPQGKTVPMLTSDPVLPSKPLGACKLHRDTSTQGHPFKISISNCYT